LSIKFFNSSIPHAKQKWWLLISILVAGGSFLLMFYMLYNVCPSYDTSITTPQGERLCLIQDNRYAWPLVLLLTLIFLGTGAITIPIAMYLNYRFAKSGWFEQDKTRLARQGGWVGLWCVSLAYLQLMRSLNWAIAVGLVGIFILLEAFLLMRE